jgi:hypothetical protein
MSICFCDFYNIISKIFKIKFGVVSPFCRDNQAFAFLLTYVLITVFGFSVDSTSSIFSVDSEFLEVL